jgi:ABC-type glycerol-3-phosphate transport system substrate-binding protein
VAFTPFPAYGGARPIRGWVATKSAINSNLAHEPAKLKAALEFLELFTSPESARLFISLAHSPQGVKVELTEKAAGPLLYAFMNSRKQATKVFALPNDPAYFGEQAQARALPDMFAAIDEGMSAKKALKFFAEVLMS